MANVKPLRAIAPKGVNEPWVSANNDTRRKSVGFQT